MRYTAAPSRPAGWLGIDAIQWECARRFRSLADSSPRLVGQGPPASSSASAAPRPILLYRAWYDVLGAEPGYPAQEIGDCVSFGHGHANDLLQCVEIGLGEQAEYRETDTEFLYAASREVAGILDGREGSYGAAAVAAMTTVGMVSREMLGDEGAYSGERARLWGSRGVPPALKSRAAAFKLGSAALVLSWDELVAALANGYPVTICLDRAFAPVRDRDGFCAPEGTLGHCMLVAGARFDRPGACVLQSWGPDNPTGPRTLDQPSFSFWADREVIEQVLAQGDSWALCRAPEFVPRTLPERWNYHQAA